MRPRRSLSVLAFLLSLGCGAEDGIEEFERHPARLELVSPASPVGLSYGATLGIKVRYLLRGSPSAKVPVEFAIVGDPAGATLSVMNALTDSEGQAAFTLFSGAAETTFRVQVSAPQAADLYVEVAVSRLSFAVLGVRVDGQGLRRGASVSSVMASLHVDRECARLAVTATPLEGVRNQRMEGAAGRLMFSTLLRRGYAITGRAEAADGRLLGYGCIDLPGQVLVAGPIDTIEVPLSEVFARPSGRYLLMSDLLPDAATPPAPIFAVLSCPLGPGQLLIDGIMAALPAVQMPLVSRLAVRRGMPGADRCRPALRGAEESLDKKLNDALTGAGQPGGRLGALARDVLAILGGLKLGSELTVLADLPRAGAVLADHRLLTVTLSTGARSLTQDLSLSPAPVLIARGLLLPLTLDRVDIPTHGLTLRLPALWRQALSQLSLVPGGLPEPPQLFMDTVAGARHDMARGCAAVEALLCEAAGPPCVGLLLPACQTAQSALSAEIGRALSDGPPDLDLTLAGFAFVEDRAGSLVAVRLASGQLQGSVVVGTGSLSLMGPLRGEPR